MWTDIGRSLPYSVSSCLKLSADYMFRRRTFTNDPDYFPTPKLREIVNYLHDHQQHYSMFAYL